MELLMFSRSLTISCAAICLLSLGCGGGSEGPTRYAISGTLKLDGKDAVAGQLTLTPDGNKGTKGPGTIVDVKDGKFSIPYDKGPVKGHYMIDGTVFDQPANTSAPRTPVGRLKQFPVEIPAANGKLELTAEKVSS
jgi:hypothetical protein